VKRGQAAGGEKHGRRAGHDKNIHNFHDDLSRSFAISMPNNNTLKMINYFS
jgi:hypothetical protein